ncbi:MAG: dolichol-phosphate mannosyltransferase [Bacteroidetes bacterium]|nr:MAG: dolichol-phosphate mannosyltransferase [Bacteroidota bacterium]
MIYFLIPIYNESSNLQQLAESLMQAAPGTDKFYVFSDDGSSDGSQKMIAEIFAGQKHIVLGDGSNHGPGYAFNTGFEWILQHAADESDLIVTLEADNTSDAAILPDMLVISGLGYDLVLASVYAQGGGFEKTSFFRKLLSNTANLFFRFFFNVKVQTLSSFYRVYRLSLLKKIKASYPVLIEESGFLCMLEILLKAIHCHARILEVPMMLRSSKRKGKSKMKIMRTSFSYMRFLLQTYFGKRHKPKKDS